ncbi:ribokinase [Frigidibacter albus]|uniref:Ribokinase n=1 Tax=Frigidibacter albus TaxID=1465486 RepID=A0A6L8VHI7_9RHOB|nr:PfkB family carbohydrate kinase [Frigidibacter albus]MZQ89564.1 ribokinase [Frigidibacter albus]NBE31470.1 ribokinase [Frigidibacter albus]GGH55300.1 ribokinase [Frigidibacter albus]
MIYNLGSINIDHVYRVPHLPAPGETLAATHYTVGLGGKGANQSVAAARAGARVLHIGAVGAEGVWARDRIAGYGVDVAQIAVLPVPTGHAIITVDPEAENSIVIFSGANQALDLAAVQAALAAIGPADTLLVQNETAHAPAAAALARGRGARVICSAAPFDLATVRAMLPHTSILVLNAVEADQLCAALGCSLDQVPVPELLVTRGKDGAKWMSNATGARAAVAALKVQAVDTTGAGDTFAGYFAAALDAGQTPAQALTLAAAAAALKVTKAGTADAIPALAEVTEFLSSARNKAL